MTCAGFMGISLNSDKKPLWQRALEKRERDKRKQELDMTRKKKIAPGWVAGISPKDRLPEGEQEWFQPWMRDSSLLPKKPPGKMSQLRTQEKK